MKKIAILLFIVLLAFPILAEITPHQDRGDHIKQQIPSSYTNSEPKTDHLHGDTEEAKLLLRQALAYIKKHGEEKAFIQFNKPGSQFFYKDLYIFAIDMDGNVLAHGGELDLVGTNQINLKDSFGKYFIQDFITNLESNKTAVVEYHWRNYDTLKIEAKLSYLEKFKPDKFVGCGIYFGDE